MMMIVMKVEEMVVPQGRYASIVRDSGGMRE